MIGGTLPETNVVDPQFLPANGERFDRAGQFETSVIVTKTIEDRDIDTPDSGSVDVGKVLEVPEVAVDVDVEVAAILTKEKGDAPEGTIKLEVKIDVVDLH